MVRGFTALNIYICKFKKLVVYFADFAYYWLFLGRNSHIKWGTSIIPQTEHAFEWTCGSECSCSQQVRSEPCNLGQQVQTEVDSPWRSHNNSVSSSSIIRNNFFQVFFHLNIQLRETSWLVINVFGKRRRHTLTEMVNDEIGSELT